MRIVLDTNVLVSGLLSPFGPPGVVVRMLVGGALQPVLDARILVEYREVCARPRFGFDPGQISVLLDHLERAALVVAPALLANTQISVLLDHLERAALVVAPALLANTLPDPDDAPFLEAALAAAAPLVTGNLTHFPAALRQGAEVMSPAEFVERFRDQGGRDQ